MSKPSKGQFSIFEISYLLKAFTNQMLQGAVYERKDQSSPKQLNRDVYKGPQPQKWEWTDPQHRLNTTRSVKVWTKSSYAGLQGCSD